MAKKQLKNKPRGSKTIRIPCSEEEYIQLLSNRKLFRPFLNRVLQKHPELFPTDIAKGYKLHGFTKPSVKLDGLVLFRIKILDNGEVYNVSPSYLIPYMCGKSEDVKDAFFCLNSMCHFGE